VVINSKFGMEDHGSIPATAIAMGLKPLDARTDPSNQIKLVVKAKKKIFKIWTKLIYGGIDIVLTVLDTRKQLFLLKYSFLFFS
jgi:hypothetical protein